MNEKLTKDAELLIESSIFLFDFESEEDAYLKGAEYALSNPDVRKASGLYTKDEVFDMIEAAFDGHIEVMPGLKFKIKRDKLPPLPTPPKTEVCGKCQMLSKANGFDDKCDEHSAR